MIGPLRIDGHAVQDVGGADRSDRRMIGRPVARYPDYPFLSPSRRPLQGIFAAYGLPKVGTR